MARVLHVVLLSWNPDTPSGVKATAQEMIQSFPFSIPGVLSVAAGENMSAENLGDGLGFGFLVTFEDTFARDAYLPHPVHLELAELLRANSARVVVFDIESSQNSPYPA